MSLKPPLGTALRHRSPSPQRDPPSGRRPHGGSFRPPTGPPTDEPPPSVLPCASHNPPDPAGAGRGKGRPQADPEGTRSALPATEAAGTLIGWDARRRYRGACRRGSRIPFRRYGSRQPTARRPGDLAASPHPVPRKFNKTHLSPNIANHESAGQLPYHQRATGAQSRGGSSRCTTTSESPSALTCGSPQVSALGACPWPGRAPGTRNCPPSWHHRAGAGARRP